MFIGKFSILIPAYKAQYLAECIDSILAQTYSNFELVIVNDASPQNLDEIVGRYHDDRIRYFKNEKNCGALHVVDNWNKCLAYAKGDYVICMGVMSIMVFPMEGTLNYLVWTLLMYISDLYINRDIERTKAENVKQNAVVKNATFNI